MQQQEGGSNTKDFANPAGWATTLEEDFSDALPGGDVQDLVCSLDECVRDIHS